MNEEDYGNDNKNTMQQYNDFLDKSIAAKEDIDNLKNRGTNKGEHSASFSRRRKDDDDNNTKSVKSKRESDLGEKESLDDNKKEKTNVKDNKNNKDKKSKSDLLDSKPENIKDKILDKTIVGKVKKLILKLKITGIILAIGAGLFAFVFFVSVLFAAYDRIIGSISTFFGISDHETSDDMSVEESDSLITQEDYLYDPDTGEAYTIDELVDTLSADNSCSKVTGLTKIADWFDSWDGKYNDVCGYIRYIESAEEEAENKYPGLKLDRGLIISTIFYGYSSQANYSEMDNPNSTEVIPATQYLKSLEDILNSGTITRDDLDSIIENSYINTTHDVYNWIIEDKKDSDGNIIESIGKCVKTTITDVTYDIKKWNVFMRFGDDAASIYEKDSAKIKMYEESSEECNGNISDDELLEMVASGGYDAKLDKSVSNAKNILSKISYGDLSLFEQAAERDGTNKDIFTSYSSDSGVVNFDYKNGFIYNKFPYFKQSIEDPNINVEYDDAITPKTIEDIRSYIVEKKPDINEILHLEDMDEGYTYLTNADTETSVILGAYCGNYLTAPIDQIKVKVTDCNGRTLRTTTFKEYITGVAYREVSDKEDDYVKAQMVAAISYALKRRNNYTKGTVITMKSGNCDQAYCPMTMGCHSEKASIKCTSSSYCTSYIPGPGSGTNTGAASGTLISKYNAYYEEVKDFLVVSGDSIYGTSYTNVKQNEWYEKASKGMSYTQIIQESYPDGTLIRCSNTNTSSTTTTSSTSSTTQYGNGVDEETYTEKAPDLGKYYGFSYSRNSSDNSITINPEWINHNIVTINSNCKEGNWEVDYQVNANAKENFEKAFKGICTLLTSGVKISNGTTCKYSISNLSGGKTFVAKETLSGVVSDLAYGIAQDWNYDKKYNINGVTYSPYDSTRSLDNYLEFVDALGSEEDCRNINYILYKYAYEPAGFVWGGNDGRNGNSGKFNGMHYRIDY